jgi:hypothetical protein
VDKKRVAHRPNGVSVGIHDVPHATIGLIVRKERLPSWSGAWVGLLSTSTGLDFEVVSLFPDSSPLLDEVIR